jgi:hypothetical protein
MPLFLSKVFGRKKHEESGHVRRASDASLLEGKFEAVSPTVSPTASNFLELFGRDKDKEPDGLFGLSKAKSGPASPNRSLGRLDELPHLTLNLPGPKDGANARALGVVFEADPESRIVLSDSEIGERRLSPLETLILVKACSQSITERGTFHSTHLLRVFINTSLQASTLLESCTLTGTLLHRTFSVNSFRCSYNRWLLRHQYPPSLRLQVHPSRPLNPNSISLGLLMTSPPFYAGACAISSWKALPLAKSPTSGLGIHSFRWQNAPLHTHPKYIQRNSQQS